MKTKIKEQALSLLLLVTLLLSAGTLGFICQQEAGSAAKTAPQKISFCGTCQIDGGPALKLTDGVLLALQGRHTVILRGHFDGDIPKNQQLVMRIDNLQVRISMDGRRLYSFGEEGGIVSRSAGNVWAGFVSPGITAEDTVEIELHNVYSSHGNTAFSSFLNNLYSGYESDLIISQLHWHFGILFLAALVLSLGLVCLVISGLLYHSKIRIPSLLVFSLLCIFGGIWFSIDFSVQSFLLPYPDYSNALDIVSLLLMSAFLITYFSLLVKNDFRRVLQVLAALCCGLVLLASVTQLTGVADYYDYSSVTIVLLVCSALIILAACYKKLSTDRTEDSGNLMLSAALICLGTLADAICYSIGLLNFTIFFKVSFLFFIILQLNRMIRIFRTIYSKSAEAAVYRKLAYQDAMTGVRNKAAYLEYIEKIDSRLPSNFGVIVFDLNNLKYVNDTRGHEEGNALIIGACGAICSAFKHSPVFRIGGDEFVAVTSGQDYQDFCMLEEKMEEELRLFNQINPQGLTISLAHGYAVYEPGRDHSFTGVFARADSSMYRNKEEMKGKGLSWLSLPGRGSGKK